MILNFLVYYSPKITAPKSIKFSSIEINAFLQVQISGISIKPVSERIGNTDLISLFSYGVNVIVIVVDKPADILPVGVY